MTRIPAGFGLQIIDAGRGDSGLEEAIGEIFTLFAGREREFGVNPAVTIDYPDLEASDFLVDPVGYIARRQADLAGPVARIVILTTYRERIGASLSAAGFQLTPIDMGAGPDGTAFLTRELGPEGSTLYIEAVNEADPKIHPGFALRLTDDQGRLCGGACGSVHQQDGRLGAYLAIMAVEPNLPAGLGTALAQTMIGHLRDVGVHRLNLGTQTADRFYEKLGFRRQHLVLPALRYRDMPDGSLVWHDLVMMEMSL